EPALPFLDMIVGARAVDYREPRLRGEPQDFHLRTMHFEQRLRAIDDVNNSGAFEQRLEQHALRLEFRIATMSLDKLPKDSERVRRLRGGQQLGQRFDGILKAGR